MFIFSYAYVLCFLKPFLYCNVNDSFQEMTVSGDFNLKKQIYNLTPTKSTKTND